MRQSKQDFQPFLKKQQQQPTTLFLQLSSLSLPLPPSLPPIISLLSDMQILLHYVRTPEH